ncbi:hypothetical protein [Sediminibacterium sp.]|nr:hypothetical protein [Sediminibacterium sp.]
MAIKKKIVPNESSVKLNMTFDEAMKKALNTPLKKIKPSTNIKKSGK